MPIVRSNRGSTPPRRSRRRLATAAWTLTVIVAVSVSYWAGREATSAPARPDEAGSQIEYLVASGTVGRTQEFAARGQWTSSPPISALRAGTVTTVFNEDRPLADGDTLLTIDLAPTILATGVVPAFRDLMSGTVGPDVQQLRRLLHTLGYLSSADGDSYDRSVSTAVRAWRRDMGLPSGDAVELGLVYFVSGLPARITLAEGVRVGTVVQPGDPLFASVAQQPTFTVNLELTQRNLVPLDALVNVTHPEGTWSGRVANATENADGLTLAISGADGLSICGAECHLVPVGTVTDYPVSIVIVPETTGAVVPVAAIKTDPAGDSYVTTSDDKMREVAIKATDGGRCVVTGVEVGERLLLPLDD